MADTCLDPRCGCGNTRRRVHARDCAPCDAARQIADELATLWDPLDNWAEVESPYSKDGRTLLDEVTGVAAGVLHDTMPGQRPVNRCDRRANAFEIRDDRERDARGAE